MRNARDGSADALSAFFLVRPLSLCHPEPPVVDALACTLKAEWLLGDTCNLIGCILTGALATQTVTAAYYVFMDVVLISQVALLAARRRHRRRMELLIADVEDGVAGAHDSSDASVVRADGLEAPLLAASRRSHSRGGPQAVMASMTMAPFMWLVLDTPPPNVGGRWLQGHDRAQGGPGVLPPCGGGSHTPAEARIGIALGWASACCYLLSRVSQLRKNSARRGASGLAFSMFAVAVLANGLYGTSVLLRLAGDDEDDLRTKLGRVAPWLVGSLGVMGLDVVLAMQALRATVAQRREHRDGHDDAGEEAVGGVPREESYVAPTLADDSAAS